MTEDKMKKKPATTLRRNPVAQAIREGYSNTKRAGSHRDRSKYSRKIKHKGGQND
jgi:hypothetical protein|tara:strand:+ start:522 stop:686 length:165 start_codon:yes stop_codon:yes gene_type:complete